MEPLQGLWNSRFIVVWIQVQVMTQDLQLVSEVRSSLAGLSPQSMGSGRAKLVPGLS